MRNLRMLGLAFVGVLAISALTVGTASATELTAETYPAQLTGKNVSGSNDIVTTTAGSVSCKNTSYTGVILAATTKVSVAPSFSECTAFSFPAAIDVNECVLIFNLGVGLTADVDLSCPAGKSLAVTASSGGTLKCTAHIGSQADIGGAANFSVAGAGTTREVSVSTELSGIDYTHTKGTGLGACTGGSSTTGTLTAKATITGEQTSSPFGHIGIFPS